MKKKTTSILLKIIIVLTLIIGIEGCYLVFDETVKEVTQVSTTVENIPVIETYIDNGKEKPMIIVQHGFKNNKDSTRDLAKTLADKGFFVISPDAYGHGERLENQLSLVEIIVKTSNDYNTLIAAYGQDSRVDTDKLGITGFSMGGCITFHYATYGKYHPKAIAPTIATPYFEQLIGTELGRSIYSAKDGLTVAKDEQKIKEIDAYINSNSPFKDYDNMHDVAVLMQNGELDKYVNSDGVTKLNEVLPAMNTNVELIMVPETKHQVKAEMKSRIVEFMVKNLK